MNKNLNTKIRCQWSLEIALMSCWWSWQRWASLETEVSWIHMTNVLELWGSWRMKTFLFFFLTPIRVVALMTCERSCLTARCSATQFWKVKISEKHENFSWSLWGETSINLREWRKWFEFWTTSEVSELCQ